MEQEQEEFEVKKPRGRPRKNLDAKSRRIYDFDAMTDSELQEEHLKLKQEKLSIEFFTDENGETKNLFQYVMKGKKEHGDSFELPDNLKVQFDRLNTLIRRESLFRGELATRNYKHDMSLLSNHKDRLIELIAKGYSLREIHEVVLENIGKKIPYISIEKFKENHEIDIANRAKLYENTLDDLPLTKKRHRLQELTDLYYSRKKLYKDAPSVQNSAEMRIILSQIKDESEGLVLKVDMDIKHAIEVHIKQEDAHNLNPHMLVLSNIAGKYGLNPNWIMARLAQSFYAKINGFINEPSQAYKPQEVMFPSQIDYDFENMEALAKSVNEQDKQEMYLVKKEVPEEQQRNIEDLKNAILDRLKQKRI